MAITESFDGIASMLTHGGAAQDFVIQLALPYASAYYKAALIILEPLAIIGLIAGFIMAFVFPMGQLKGYFVGLLLVVLLLSPGEYRTGDSALWFSSDAPANTEGYTGFPDTELAYPKSIVIFFNLVGTLEKGLYKAVDVAVDKLDGGASSSILSSRALALAEDASVQATASPELVAVHRLYRSSCQPKAAEMGLSTVEMQALGFQGGMMMGFADRDVVGDPTGTVSFWRSLWPMGSRVPEVDGDELSNRLLRGITASASSSGVFLAEGSLIPSKSFFVMREEGSSSAGGFLKRSDVGGSDRFAHPDPAAASSSPERFYAGNCDELHDMVQYGNRSYYAFIEGVEMKRGQLVRDEPWYADFIGGSAPSYTSQDVAKLARPQYFQGMMAVNRAISEGNSYQGMAGNNRGDSENGYIDSATKALGLQISTFWKKWNLNLAPVAAMGVVAMGTGLLFIFLPLVIVFSVLPGRLSTLAATIKVILFAKTTLLLMYITCRLSLVVSTASMFSVLTLQGAPTSLNAGMISLAVMSQLIALITLLTAAPLLAYFLVFNEARGLSTLSPGSIGKDAIRSSLIAAGAALQVTRLGGGAAKVMANNTAQNGAQAGGNGAGSGGSMMPGKGVPK